MPGTRFITVIYVDRRIPGYGYESPSWLWFHGSSLASFNQIRFTERFQDAVL